LDAGPTCLDHVIAHRNQLPGLPEVAGQACGFDRVPPGGPAWDYVCFAAPAGGRSCAATYDPNCVLGAFQCGLDASDILCGPQPPREGLGIEPGACCYVLTSECIAGRPFLVEGRARLARAAEGEGWRTPVAPDTTALDTATRNALADLYRQDALTEHASVASFARFVLQCLALGAPAEIVLEAQRAGLEEVEHAQLSFGLASAYSGRPERALELDVRGALDGALDAREVALGVAREGCIAETVSALVITAARDQAEDPVVRQILTQVAKQELRHAELAWRYLAWALERGDRELRRAIARVFADPEREVALGPTTSLPGNVEKLRAHGWLPIDERRAIALAALREVVLPAAKVLLAMHSAVDAPALGQPPKSSIPPLSTASSAGASPPTLSEWTESGGISIALPGPKRLPTSS